MVLRIAAIGRKLLLAALLAAPAPAAAIVGGAPATGASASQVVMVLAAGGGVCSGLVVARDTVLTAAHCIAGGRDIRVHFRDEAGTPVLMEPAATAIHPGYNAQAISRRERSIDLGLVRTKTPLPSRFSPATLGTANPRQGTSLVVTGWGLSNETNQDSMGTLLSARLEVIEPYGPGKILIWAADPHTKGKSAGAGVCHGDSGGPLLDASGTVIAISSWSKGANGSDCGLLTQGILTGPQRKFIDSTLTRWGRKAIWN